METLIHIGNEKIKLLLPEKKVVGIFKPESVLPAPDLESKIEQALAEPIASAPLEDMVASDMKIVIVVDDISRPLPTQRILSVLLKFLERKYMRLDNITILVATGVHRRLTQSELDVLAGHYKGKVRIENHDPDDENNLVPIGTTSFANQIKINKKFVEADLRILTGDIEYHQFCGYGGGAKSIFPGIADRLSIQQNHSRQHRDGAEQGEWLNNPVRQEIEEVGKMVHADFLVNVVLNHEYQVIDVFAGDVQAAFLQGTKLVDKIYKKTIPESVDLVLTSPGGYPKDIDLYQSQKAVRAAAKIVKQHGKIILFAECKDGHGSELFYNYVKQANTLHDIVSTYNQQFILGAHKAYQYAHDMLRADVYLYSSLADEFVKTFFLKPIKLVDINEMIENSDRIAVLPFASSTHVVLE